MERGQRSSLRLYAEKIMMMHTERSDQALHRKVSFTHRDVFCRAGNQKLQVLIMA